MKKIALIGNCLIDHVYTCEEYPIKDLSTKAVHGVTRVGAIGNHYRNFKGFGYLPDVYTCIGDDLGASLVFKEFGLQNSITVLPGRKTSSLVGIPCLKDASRTFISCKDACTETEPRLNTDYDLCHVAYLDDLPKFMSQGLGELKKRSKVVSVDLCGRFRDSDFNRLPLLTTLFQADFIFLSDIEAFDLFGKNTFEEIAHPAQKLVGKGTGVIIIHSPERSLLAFGNRVIMVDAPEPLKNANTFGAGDFLSCSFLNLVLEHCSDCKDIEQYATLLKIAHEETFNYVKNQS